MSEPPPRPPARAGPALGALDGVKRDLQAAKEAHKKGDLSDPNSIGSAWTHNFLNQKPWHPMNFRNQARVWEAEQQHYETEKRKADIRAEHDAEQEYLKTLSMLSRDDQEKYRERQSVSFLYMRPPGYDASVERQGAAQREGGASTSAPEPQKMQQEAQQDAKKKHGDDRGSGGNYLSKVLEGFRAASQEQYELNRKGMIGLGQHVDAAQDQPSQQLVLPELDSDEEEKAFQLASMSEAERRTFGKQERRKASAAARDQEREELEQAKAVLRAAGIQIPDDSPFSSSDESDGATAGNARHHSSTRRKSKHKRSREDSSQRKGKKKKKNKETSKRS